MRRHRAASSLHRIADVERHPDRTFCGVVVTGIGIVEEHHDPVAGEPLERALDTGGPSAPIARWYSASTPITSSGSLVSANGVKFRMSANSTTISRRWLSQEVLVADDQIGQLR